MGIIKTFDSAQKAVIIIKKNEKKYGKLIKKTKIIRGKVIVYKAIET